MFVRVSNTANSPRKSVRVVECYREGYKVKQRMIHHVGIASSEEEIEKLKRIGFEFIAKEKEKIAAESQQTTIFKCSFNEEVDALEKAAQKSENERRGRKPRVNLSEILPASEVALNEVVEEARVIEGIDEAFGKVYDDLGYNNILSKIKDKELLKNLVLARIARPASKHKTQKILVRQYNKDYDLGRIYRLLDKLHPEIDNIKTITFNGTLNLTPNDVNIVFFDVTTLYFESTTEDELRAMGYSKDHRFNTTQLVLALATNPDGLPIGYELFKGNKAEVGTLCAAIESWSSLFKIESVCFVGDRAMMSRLNIKMIKEKGYKYVIAAKLQSMPKSMQEQLLDNKNYKPVMFGEIFGRVGEFVYEDSRLIVSYKQTRADHDAYHRKKILEKIEKRIGKKGNTKKLISNYGVSKYTTTTATSETIIDNDKVARDTAWDGLHGVITNLKETDALLILQRYSGLWIIEESFRINKHTLSMRPIYHFKEERIEAHIALCYLAFATLRNLQYKVALTTKISPECIIDELIAVQASILVHKETGHKYRMPGKFSHVAAKIYKALNIIRNQNTAPILP